MGDLVVRGSRPLAYAIAPILALQGARIRRSTPDLPEAAGDRCGVEGADASTDADPLAVLVFGESTAAGVGVATQAEGLGPAVAAGLAARRGRSAEWQVVGRKGYTARRAVSKLLPRLGEVTTYDVVVVALGVNDVLRLTAGPEWEAAVTELATALHGRLGPGGVIVLAGLPDIGLIPTVPQPTRAVLRLHARNLDRRLAAVASSVPSTVHAPAPHLDGIDGMYADDGFHPGAAGYRRWAEHLVDAAVTCGGRSAR